MVHTKQLLRKYPQRLVQFIWFTDEKLFTVTRPVNLQNDRVYVAVPMRKKHVAANCFVLVQISLNPSWFQSGYQVLAAESLSLSIQGSKLMVHTIVTFYSVSTYCLLKNCQAVNFSYSSRQCSSSPSQRNCGSAFKRNSRFYFTDSLAHQ